MKTKTMVFVTLLLALMLTAGTAAAQSAPFNDVGVTMGHWHIASKDVEANKKLFLAMGGKLYTPGGNPLIMLPGVLINLNLGTEKGEGGSQGSVVNHVGFIVDNVQKRVAEWKAGGVTLSMDTSFPVEEGKSGGIWSARPRPASPECLGAPPRRTGAFSAVGDARSPVPGRAPRKACESPRRTARVPPEARPCD